MGKVSYFKKVKRKNLGRVVKTKAQKKFADGILILCVAFLLIFGVVMITSIGVPKSIQLSAPNVMYPNCADEGIDCYFLLKRHLTRIGIGLIAMLIASKIPLSFWKKIAPVFYIGTVIALFAVLLMGARFTTFASRWIVIFNTSVQPLEFAKLAIIFYLGAWLYHKKNKIHDFQEGFLPFCIIVGMMILPILLQPDMGGSLMVGGIAAGMLFVGGGNLKHMFLAGFISSLVAIVLIFNVSHLQMRFTTFLQDTENCRLDECWQSEQSKIAIGSGGLWGKGLTQGVQKSYWLPQATDDFIFAASAEELGFLRISLIILVFGLIAYRGILIARGAQNDFEMLIAYGVTLYITLQAIINLAVNLGLMPVTGITLPLVSYGGSSMISVLIAIGVLLNISKNSNYENNSLRRRDGGSYHAKYIAS